MTILDKQTIKNINLKLEINLSLISGDKALLNAISVSTPAKVAYETIFTKHYDFSYSNLNTIRENLKKLYNNYKEQLTTKTLEHLLVVIRDIDILLKHYAESIKQQEKLRQGLIAELNKTFE